MKCSIDAYVNEVEKTLKSTNKYDDIAIGNIIKKIADPYDKVDPIANIKGYKSLKKIYLSDVNPDDMFYLSLNDRVKALSVKTGENTYVVSFSFFNSKEEVFDAAPENTWKKYPLINYIKGRFTYSVDATSPINAICLAYNKNKKKFPGKRSSKFKAVPFVQYIWPDIPGLDPVVGEYPGIEDCSGHVEAPPYFDHNGVKYFNAKNELKQTGVKLSDVRYYITQTFLDSSDPGVSAMVVKNSDNTFTVTFSFLSKEDEKYILKYLEPCSATKLNNATKVALINNRLCNKFTYTVSDTRNSITSIIKAFNKNRRSFPSRYRKFKVKMNAYLACRY